jgi:hypothetical protein
MRLRKEGVRPARRASARRRLGMSLATAGLLAGSLTTAVVMSAPAGAASLPTSGTYSLENYKHPGYCLSSGGVSDSTATVFACISSSNQHWHRGNSHGNYQQIINGDGQCLGVSSGSTSAGAHLVVWKCNGNDDQYWYMEFPHIFNIPFFRNQRSQLVMQIACDCSTNSSVVEQEPYAGDGTNNNQYWRTQNF